MNQRPTAYYVDGANNPGFSGGPIVSKKAGSGKFQIIGVIKGFALDPIPVVKKDDLKDPKPKAYKDLYVRTNTGIVVGYSLKHIVEAIEKQSQR